MVNRERRRTTAGPTAGRSRFLPDAEALERRSLLSAVPGPVAPPLMPAAHRAHSDAPAVGISALAKSLPPFFFRRHGIMPPPAPPKPKHHPLSQVTHDGAVAKQPMFYEGYRGPQRPGLNAVAATGRVVPGVGFVFTGTVQGPIDTSMTTHFVFGVNRGGSKGFGPIPKRRNLVSDAAVDVTVGPSGTTGKVLLYPTQPVTKEVVELPNNLAGTGIPPLQPITFVGPTTTPKSVQALPAENVRVEGNTVTAIVPAGDLHPSSPNPDGLFLTRYSFAFSVQLVPNDPAMIASFAPEYNAIPLAIPRR